MFPFRLSPALLLSALLASCATIGTTPIQEPAKSCLPNDAPGLKLPACPACPACPVVPTKPDEPAKPSAAPFEATRWEDLPHWPGQDGLAPALTTLTASCARLQQQAAWKPVCAAAGQLDVQDEDGLKRWFEQTFRPWQLINPDGSREGLITGYYEPVLKASRKQKSPYLHPIYGVPDDLIAVDLGELYPELKHMRLRGRIEGRKLVPYYPRADWDRQATQRKDNVLFWADDPLDVFFMQIQGSGQIRLDDGSRVRVGYADQNGHPYRSIGRWLIERGELKPEQASMQGIRHWLKSNPKRMQELLDANPSYVFFRELPLKGDGPPGAMGIPLTPERSLAIDPRTTPLGVPIWLETSHPNTDRALNRLMASQDTGGAIRGPVRADFYWGSGTEAGNQAGKMRQKGRMWALFPVGLTPPGLEKAP